MKKLGGKVFLIGYLVLCSAIFFGHECRAADKGEVLINEIAWMGTIANANNEWLELKNTGAADITLAGWTLDAADGTPKINLSGSIAANGYYLLERTSNDLPGVTADLVYSGALGNGGEDLLLKDGAGNLIDEIDASGGWPAGDNDIKQPMERRADGSWQTSEVVGGTPRSANGEATADPVDQGSDDQSTGDESADQSSNDNPSSLGDSGERAPFYGQVLINEFVSIPAAGENEWVELYNPSGGKLSLSGWTIADGSGAATVLSGGFDANDYYFFVKEKFKGALNNSGDEIILYSGSHNLIDKVTYGKFGDQPSENAPAPASGEACALKTDGQKELYDKDSYILTATPTKGKKNIITPPAVLDDSAASSSPVAAASTGKIIITEILPNPAGGQGEFIELYNGTAAAADLTGYKIEVEGGRSFQFGEFLNFTRQLPAASYFPLYRADSNLVLDNNGGVIKLYPPGSGRASQVLSYAEAPAGFSYCDTEYLDLANADSATKKFLANSLLGDRWVWSGEPTPGKANQVKDLNHAPHASFSVPENIVAGQAIDFDAADSFDEDGDPLSYVWDFGDSSGFTSAAPSHVFAKAGTYQVRLTVSDGQDSTVMQKPIKVSGTGRIDASSVISKNIVVGTQKLASAPAKSGTIKKPVVKPAVQGVKIIAAKITEPAIKDLKFGAAVKRSGTVIMPPGVFGSQYFYLGNSGEAAVKIYNYHKSFPALKIGDLVTVSGVVGGSAADKYLKTKSAADIKILKSGATTSPEKITIAGFKEENINKFVQAAGEIQQKSSSELSLQNGTGTIKIYLKKSTNVSAAAFKAGQQIAVTGLLSDISGSLAIVPRFQADMAAVVASGTNSDASGSVLGAATGSAAWTLPTQADNNQLPIYMLIFGGGILAILAGFFLKKFTAKRSATTETLEQDSSKTE